MGEVKSFDILNALLRGHCAEIPAHSINPLLFFSDISITSYFIIKIGDREKAMKYDIENRIKDTALINLVDFENAID